MLVCPECRKLYPSDASECPDDGQLLVPAELLVSEKDTGLKPGTMVGEYRIDRKLGSGSFGAVYAATQPLIDKQVAIKVLHKKFASEAGVVSRFVAEARVVNRIKHRNIIDVFSFGLLDDQQPYFVMDLLEGMTLGELLHREKRIAVPDALAIVSGIADALDAAHEAGVAHRDLKPDNIFLAIEKGGGYFPKLLDFGVAKLVDDDLSHKTATGAAIGTPSYMAPEQCRGKRVDHRADIYALGVVIHEMLTGRRLFQADSAMDVLLMHVSEPPPPMSQVCPDLPRELDAPVLTMLAKKPEKRPSSAGAAVAELARCARESGADRATAKAKPAAAQTTETPPAALERAMAQRDDATATSAGSRFSAAAKTPSEEAPAVQGSLDASALALPDGGDDAPRPDDAAASMLKAPAMTSDGRFVLSSKGNTIKVWDLRTGQAVHTFQGQAALPDATATRAPIEEPAASPSRAARSTAATARRGARRRSWTLVAAGAAIVAGAVIAAAIVQAGRAPAPVPVTAETAAHPPAPPVAEPAHRDALGRPR